MKPSEPNASCGAPIFNVVQPCIAAELLRRQLQLNIRLLNPSEATIMSAIVSATLLDRPFRWNVIHPDDGSNEGIMGTMIQASDPSGSVQVQSGRMCVVMICAHAMLNDSQDRCEPDQLACAERIGLHGISMGRLHQLGAFRNIAIPAGAPSPDRIVQTPVQQMLCCTP